MRDTLEKKILVNADLDKNTKMIVHQNKLTDRICVEFSTKDRKLVVEKNFPNTIIGRKESSEFQERITCLKDLKNYFGIKE